MKSWSAYFLYVFFASVFLGLLYVEIAAFKPSGGNSFKEDALRKDDFGNEVSGGNSVKVNICGRTPQVRDAILKKLSKANCGSVNKKQLADIDSLDLSLKHIAR